MTCRLRLSSCPDMASAVVAICLPLAGLHAIEFRWFPAVGFIPLKSNVAVARDDQLFGGRLREHGCCSL